MRPRLRTLALGAGLGLAFLFSRAEAGEETLGALFLDEPAGARATAMGESLIAAADDVNAVFWNPAALARTGRRELLLSHAQSYQGFRNEYAAFSLPWSERDAFGANAFFDYNDGFEKFSTAGEPDGTFSLYDLYAGISWSHVFSSRFSTGLAFKSFYQSIAGYRAAGFAADVSCLGYQLFPNFNLGFTLKNLGKPPVFIQEAHPLNTALELGAAYSPWENSPLLTLALRKPLAQEMIFKFGAEYAIQDLIFLRGGYRYSQFGNDLGPLSGLTLGLGVRVAEYNLDYSYTPFPDLGDVHRVTMTLPFGRSVKEEQLLLDKLEQQVKAKQASILAQAVREGDRFLAEGALEKASAAYNRALGISPNSEELNQKLKKIADALARQAAEQHSARAQKAIQAKDYLTALVEGSKILELLPQDPEALRMVALANQKLSAEKLSADTDKNRQLIEQYFQQGLQCLQSGRYGDALELWKKILALDPKNNRVTQYLRLTQSKVADLVEDLLHLADQDWESRQYLPAVKKWRQVLEISNRQPDALACLETRQAKLSELADQYYRLGVEQYIRNELDAAVETWKNVLTFEPKNQKALRHLEHVKMKRKELEALK